MNKESINLLFQSVVSWQWLGPVDGLRLLFQFPPATSLTTTLVRSVVRAVIPAVHSQSALPLLRSTAAPAIIVTSLVTIAIRIQVVPAACSLLVGATYVTVPTVAAVATIGITATVFEGLSIATPIPPARALTVTTPVSPILAVTAVVVVVVPATWSIPQVISVGAPPSLK